MTHFNRSRKPTASLPLSRQLAGIGKCPRLIQLWIVVIISFAFITRAETVSIVIASNAAPRVRFGAQKLAEVLKGINVSPEIIGSKDGPNRRILLSPQLD